MTHSNPAISSCQQYLKVCPKGISLAMEEVNVYCPAKYDPKIHKMLFCTPHHQVFDHKAIKNVKHF
jgi:hypothetical protein